MAANPRMVNKDITVAWDGGSFNVGKGTIVDIPAGSSLEAAYGAGNLVAISAASQSGDDPGEFEPEGEGTG
jgi:hypothetical protein